MQMKTMTTPCEICQANDWDTVYMGPILDGRLKGNAKSAARLCKTCGVIRLDDSMGADEYSTQTYRQKLKEPTDAEGFYSTHDGEQIYKLLRINDLKLRDKKVLDIGAAAGAFIDYIRGVAAQVSAIEPCRQYEEALFKKCFEVYPFIQQVAAGRKYDLITCFDTIEHVQDPSATLQAAYKLLAPGGTLVCSTGEYEPLAAVSRPSTYFRTQHKWYWTDESFWEAYMKTIKPIAQAGTEAWLECIHEPHGPQMYLYVRKPSQLNW